MKSSIIFMLSYINDKCGLIYAVTISFGAALTIIPHFVFIGIGKIQI